MDFDENDWFLVFTPQGSYIGRSRFSDDFDLVLDPVFTYVSQLVQNREGQMQRQAFCLPFDVMHHGAPMAIVGSYSLVSIKAMHREDKRKYQGMVETAIKNLLSARSGLVTA